MNNQSGVFMKKILLFIFVFMLFTPIVYASSGRLVKASVVSCNGISYGYHSTDKHWHVAVLNSDGSYNASGDILGYTNPCQSQSGTSSSSTTTTTTTEATTITPTSNTSTTTTTKANMVVTLSSCVDGDTAKFNTDKGVESIRFLAIDTPESTIQKEAWGTEASVFTCNKLKNATKIVLEFDKNSNLYDKYNRLLAWIWVDEYLLQDEIVKNGYGEVAYLYGNYKYTALLQDHQAVAEAQGLNMWSSSNNTTSTTTSSTSTPTKSITTQSNVTSTTQTDTTTTTQTSDSKDSNVSGTQDNINTEKEVIANSQATGNANTVIDNKNDTTYYIFLIIMTSLNSILFKKFGSKYSIIGFAGYINNDKKPISKVLSVAFYVFYIYLALPVYYDLIIQLFPLIIKKLKLAH